MMKYNSKIFARSKCAVMAGIMMVGGLTGCGNDDAVDGRGMRLEKQNGDKTEITGIAEKYREKENKQKKNSYLVIDGKQRLLSIRRFYSNVSEKEFKEKNLKEKDAFKQLKLKGLDILKDFNGKTYSQMQVENAEYVKFDGNFDYAVMAQSPNYTPASADFILDIFREYIEEI